MSIARKSFALVLVCMFLYVSFAADALGVGNPQITLISTSQTEHTITLSWTPPFPAVEQKPFKGYEIFRKTSDGWFSYWRSPKDASYEDNVAIIKGLSQNTTYYFKVVSYVFDSSGLHSVAPESNLLEVKTLPATTPLSTPTPVTTPNSTPTVPELPWFVVVPLLVVLFSVALLVKHRKPLT